MLLYNNISNRITAAKIEADAKAEAAKEKLKYEAEKERRDAEANKLKFEAETVKARIFFFSYACHLP